MTAEGAEASGEEEEDRTNVSLVQEDVSTNSIIERARRAANLAKKPQEKTSSSSNNKDKRATAKTPKRSGDNIDLTGDEQNEPYKIPRMVNSAIFPKKDRPDWLAEDNIIDSLPTATVANVISQHKMTIALERQNSLREDKATKSKGGLKTDQEIKIINMVEGEDNATSKLHEQRFMMRTPLLEPSKYWDLYPVKWPEVNKRIHLTHLGLDSIISAKTLEIIHDRSDPTLTIKMFSPTNVMIGREGASQRSKVKQMGSYLELESYDSWLEVATISGLEEALDNLCRVWTSMWPGEFGPANIRGVVSKHRAFSQSFENPETRKKILEDFINRALGDNAVRAGQKLPPLSFKEIDERAKDLMDRRQEFTKQNKEKNQFNQKNQFNSQNPQNTNSAFQELRHKLKSYKDICVWYNLSTGCQKPNCDRKHICGKIPKGRTEPCKDKHALKDCKK